MSFYKLYRILNEGPMDPEQSVPPTYVAYTAVVLYDLDRRRLLRQFQDQLPPDWEVTADHMTINIEEAVKGPAASMLGKQAVLEVRSFAIDEMVAAVRVESTVPSMNRIKHITLAFDPNGGSAKDSNNLKNWKPVEPFRLKGVVKEVERQGEPRQPRVHTPQSDPAPNNPLEFVRQMRDGGKPPDIIRRAMKGKFPGMTEDEIEMHMGMK